MTRKHKVSVVVEGKEVDRWLDYSIANDMLSAADDFSMTVGPITRELYELLTPDSAIEVYIDGTRVLTGFIGTRERRKSRGQGSLVTITGRDRGGRLIDESMPLKAGLRGLTLERVAELVAGQWFERVTFSNGVNRSAIRGRRAGKAAAWDEPSSAAQAAAKKANLAKYKTTPLGGLFEATRTPRKVEPGETRWDTLQRLLEPARFLAWSSADGRELVVGVPNYDQQPQFQFFIAADSQSARRGFTNVVDLSHVSSTEERYSDIVVLGASRGDSSTYGRAVARSARVTSPGFKHPKELIVQDDAVKNPADALARAHREMALRDKTAEVLQITVDGHSQRFNRASDEAIYAFDTVAEYLDEELDVGGRWYITAVTFLGSRDSQTTELTLVPVGTELSL